jgi:hypothetical protein
VAITISAEDPRTIKAIQIAAGAGQWLKCHTTGGAKAYGVPSQGQSGRYYLVTLTSCTCLDAQRHPAEACKHQLAVRLHCELLKAEQQVRPTTRRHGHLRLLPMPVVALAAKYDEIFKRFEGD